MCSTHFLGRAACDLGCTVYSRRCQLAPAAKTESYRVGGGIYRKIRYYIGAAELAQWVKTYMDMRNTT